MDFPEMTYPKDGEAVFPDNISIQEIVEGAIRGKWKLTQQQQRLIHSYLPHVLPKLMAVANVTEGSFAKMLDAAIARSQPKLFELKPEAPIETEPTEHSASELKGPMSQLRRW